MARLWFSGVLSWRPGRAARLKNPSGGFILLFCAACCAGAGAARLKKAPRGIYPAFLRAVLRWCGRRAARKSPSGDLSCFSARCAALVLGSGLLRGSGVGAASLVSGAGLGAGPRWWFGAWWCWLFLFSGGGASGAAFGFSFLLVCGCFLAACAGRCVSCSPPGGVDFSCALPVRVRVFLRFPLLE